MKYTETELTDAETQLDIVASHLETVENLFSGIKDEMKPLLSAIEKLPKEMRKRFYLDPYEPTLHDIEGAESAIYEIQGEIQDRLYQLAQADADPQEGA